MSQAINLSKLNGKTVTLGELINGINEMVNSSKSKVYIPMYQRNYKWSQDMANKLISELLRAYNESKNKSLSLFTLHINDKKQIHIVDGQQRLITLLLLFKALGKMNDFIPLEFERDFSLINDTRIDFITSILEATSNSVNLNATIALSDKRRLQYNYNGISKIITNTSQLDKDKFIQYLRDNINLLLHITEDEPVSEFLNLNCNKTKFSICDRVRSALITYTTFNIITVEEKKSITTAIECSDYKKGISQLFEELTRLLYRDDIYNTIKLGYEDPDKTKENRINIMFSNLVNTKENGYMACKSLDNQNKVELLVKLAFYKKILLELEEDFNNKNYITSEAFKNFYDIKGKNKGSEGKFFALLDKYIEKDSGVESNKLSRILHTEHSIDSLIMDYIKTDDVDGGDIYFVNSYFEVLSKNKQRLLYKTLLKEHYEKENATISKYFPVNKNIFEDIVQSSGKYILYRYIEDHQKENDNIINFPPTIEFKESMLIDLEEISEENKLSNNITVKDLLCTNSRKIIIPVIQRDYCMGSHFNKIGKENMLDYIIKNYNDNKKQITLSAITIFQPNSNDIYIYDGQQRMFTLLCLVKILESNISIKLNEISFEHRENFNDFIKDFLNNAEKKLKYDSYAKKSVENLKQSLESKLKGKDIDKDELKDYILQSISVDVIVVNGALSSAEQFFVEINDGVQLKPYEIFKCKINDRCKALFNEGKSEDINSAFYKQWINKLDNDWLDFFYVYRKIDINNESAVEELMEMRLIEFCCRMLYWEKYISNPKEKTHPLSLKSFSFEGTEMGDMDTFINSLDYNDFRRIFHILENLVKFQDNVSNSSWNIRLHAANDNRTGFYFFDTSKYNRNAFIKCFLEALYADSIDSSDIIIWEILKQKQDDDIKKSMVIWNNQKINGEPFAFLIPYVIGTWEHVCLSIPQYYIKKQSANASLLDKIVKRIKKVENEYKLYDNVMKNASNTTNSQQSIPCVKDILHENIYAKCLNGLVNIDEFSIFYFYKNDRLINFSEGKILMLQEKNHVMIYKKERYYPLINQAGTRFLKNTGTIIEKVKNNNRWSLKVKTETTQYIYEHTISCLIL